MRKVLSVILVVCMCGAMIMGCGKQNETKQEAKKEEKYADKDFMKDLVKSLETRWALNEADESKGYQEGSEEQKEAFSKMIKAELDIVQKYEDEKFENSKLKELALQYINSLRDQEGSLKYATVDSMKYSELWQTAYNSRTKIIAQFKTDYNLTVSEKYQGTLDELLTNAQLVTDEENTKTKVEEFVKGIPFTLEIDEYGWKTYSAVVENTTGLGFKTLPLTINLLDADGVIVESTYSQVENFAAGAKARFEFMTDKEFVSTDIKTEYYELSK